MFAAYRDPRYTNPPITAQSPLWWSYWVTGRTVDDKGVQYDACEYRSVPSQQSHPKFFPATPPPTRSISSMFDCPTSPIHSAPPERSNENRHGLRIPYSQISFFEVDDEA